MALATTSMIIDDNKMRERDEEIDKLMRVVSIILDALGDIGIRIKGEITEGQINIDTSDEVAGVLMTVFTCLRKEQNDKQGHLKYKSYEAQINGVKISITSIVDTIKAKKIELNFLVATPIVELMTLFKASFDEVRTGVTRFRVREEVAKRGMKRDAAGKLMGRLEKSKDNTQNITQYGLNNHHVPLLQGITFAPERRTGVIRSLGPMAQALMLVMEDKYHNKLVSALANSLQMLPMATEIITCLKEAKNPGNVAGILKELGDILILSTARSTQKFYFPLLLLAHLWSTKPQTVSWSFSGAGMLKYFSEAVVKNNITFTIKSNGGTVKTAEVVFHAIFGTYLDDLHICEEITNHPGSWSQRKEMNTVFTRRAEASNITFSPIIFKFVSKMAQALQTKSLGNVEPVDTCRPSFSGFRKRNFTNEFLNYLRTGRATQNFSTDPTQLQYALKKTKDQLLEDIDTVKLLRAGTVNWETWNGGAWVPCDFVPSEGGKKFFGA